MPKKGDNEDCTTHTRLRNPLRQGQVKTIFVRMKAVLACLLLCVSIPFAQLVLKKAPAQNDAVDSVVIPGVTKNRPLVYSDSATLRSERAASDAKAAMDLEYSNDSLTGTLIGIGAEYVGQTMKNMLSPNSAEADAVEREWQKR